MNMCKHGIDERVCVYCTGEQSRPSGGNDNYETMGNQSQCRVVNERWSRGRYYAALADGFSMLYNDEDER